jgi:hypothetical protein
MVDNKNRNGTHPPTNHSFPIHSVEVLFFACYYTPPLCPLNSNNKTGDPCSKANKQRTRRIERTRRKKGDRGDARHRLIALSITLPPWRSETDHRCCRRWSEERDRSPLAPWGEIDQHRCCRRWSEERDRSPLPPWSEIDHPPLSPVAAVERARSTRTQARRCKRSPWWRKKIADDK